MSFAIDLVFAARWTWVSWATEKLGEGSHLLRTLERQGASYFSLPDHGLILARYVLSGECCSYPALAEAAVAKAEQQLSPRGAGLLELCLRGASRLVLDSRGLCSATTPRLLYPGSNPPKVLLVLLMSPPPYCLPASRPCCLSCPPPPSLDPFHSGCSSTDAARLLARLA